MHFKNKIIYLFITILVISLIFPIDKFCFDSDSIYVWSNSSDSINNTMPVNAEINNDSELNR